MAATAGPMLAPVSNSSAATARRALGDLVEARPQPVEPAVDRCGLLARQLGHRPAIAMGPRHRLGDPEPRRPALVGGMVHIAPFPLDQLVDQIVNHHATAPPVRPSRSNLPIWLFVGQHCEPICRIAAAGAAAKLSRCSEAFRWRLPPSPLFPRPAAAKLSPAETRMIQTVDAEQERTLAMLEKWVNQNSGSLNIEGVTKVGEMLRAELEPLGFKVQWIDMRQTGRAGHIVATHKGNGRGKRLLLIGHLDTVFEPDSPFQRWERRGNDGDRPGLRRRQGRHGGDDRRAACDASAGHAQGCRHRGRPDRRRGG